MKFLPEETPTGLEVFTDPWARAWADELDASDAYRQAAATWEGSMVLEMTAEEGRLDADRAVFADLWHGECRAARRARDEDREGADFVIRADAGTWQRVLAGDLEPIFGIMSGKLKLARGSLARLTPHLAASRELVLAATRVDSTFPNPTAAG